MEEDVLGAEGVSEDGIDGGDRATQVLYVERDGDVNEVRVAGGGVGAGDPVALVGIAEERGLAEGEAPVVAAAADDLVGEPKVGVELGRSDGLRRREGLEGRGEDYHGHGGGEEAGEFEDPQHLSPAIAAPCGALPGLEVEEIGEADEVGGD